MRQVLIFLLLILVGAASATAEGVAFNPPDGVITDTAHNVTIKRTYHGMEQAKLLLAAETIHPKREDVLEAMGKRGKDALATSPTEHLWWYDMFDGVFVPYAITAPALSYYAKLSDSFRKGDFTVSKNFKMERSSLSYTAEVTEHQKFVHEGKSFQNVSVVTMSLSWRQQCGDVCAMVFSKKRIVVFDKHGTVLHVFHDGKTRYAVS